MTALCSGGASGPKSGVAETIIFTTSALASLLNNKGGGWALLVAPLLGVLAYDATSFCGTDPPSDPGMTSDDYKHLLKLDDLGAVATALGKLADMAKIAIWYEMCQCTSVATPDVPPTLWAPPDGIPNLTTGSRAPCWSWSSLDFPTVYTSGLEPVASWRLYPLPAGTHRTGSYGSAGLGFENVIQVARQQSWTDITISVEYVTRPSTNENVYVALNLFSTGDTSLSNIALAQIGGTGSGFPGSKVVSGSLSGFSGRDWMALIELQVNNATPKQIRVTIDAFCGGVPGGSVAPCVSDPAAMALLQQIWSLLQLVQRQHVPFAHLSGAAHTGLTGQGEVTVTGLLGFSVELTAVPDRVGSADYDPDMIFDVGQVAYGNADGWDETRPLRTMDSFIRVPADTTKIGYAFTPGVTATINEHIREPNG